MKPALWYSIVMRMGVPTVVAITSERANRWWGRDCRTDLGTNGVSSDLMGRFVEKADAEATLGEVQKVKSHFRRQHEELSRASSQLHQAEEALVRQVTEGEPKRGAQWLSVTVAILELKR